MGCWKFHHFAFSVISNPQSMSVLAVFGHLKGLFYDGVVIDDPVFKLHYGFTTYLLLFMTFLTVGKVFLNDPIYCSLQMYEWERVIPKDMLNNYCYINSTFIVPVQDNAVELKGTYSRSHGIGTFKDEAIYHSYYQWISLMLFIQGNNGSFLTMHGNEL